VRRPPPLLLALGLAVLLLGTASADGLPDLRARYEREKGKDFNTRLATLNEIAALGTLDALRFLERVVRDDADAGIRANAIYSVARVDLPEAADSLLRLWKEDDPGHRSSLLAAWTSYRKEPLPPALVAEVLAGKDASTRTSVLTWLGRSGDARFLAEARRFVAEFPQSATSAISPLTQAPSPEAARLLLEIYDDDRPYDRDTVSKFFAGAAPAVRAVLVDAVALGREPLLSRAARLCARAQVAEAETALVAAARAAKDDERRAALLEAAGRVGLATDAGRTLALECLRSPKEPLAIAGARALRARPVAEAVPPLIDLLAAKSERVRAEARVTLERTTGQEFGTDAPGWERWWRENGAAFDPGQVKAPAADALDRTLVDLALAKGAAALRAVASSREAKDPKGPWEYGGHPVGTTALVLLALHAAGTDPKDRVYAGALRWLVEQPVPATTYDAGLVAMTLETVGGRRWRAKVAEAAKILVASQNARGFWGYPSGNGDHSNSQYAVLGLRHAVRAGVAVPAKTWKAARDHWLETQDADGGWTYVPQGPKDVSTSSMTAAGVSCLLLCLENGDAADPRRGDVAAAIDRGFEALGRLAKLDKDSLYALYGIERAGMLGGRARLGTVPWYAPGARRLLDEQTRDGFWVGSYDRAVDSAFAILFLKKATPPVAAATTTSEPAEPR
jgi:hypothetical protein